MPCFCQGFRDFARTWTSLPLLERLFLGVTEAFGAFLRRAGFFGFEREIAEALTGAHFSWAQDQVIGVHGAGRVAILGEGELDGGKGVPGFEGADFGQTDSVKFLEGDCASAAACGEIGRERGDAFEEVLCSGTEIDDHWFL
jgi:hypothetical protein